ncbi:signal peptidase I [Geobacter sp. AOG2]|uniref:signal peptidase I n=1 Tax=Geobacter sp. AOG2 TaxID=1566347 RepID=UPI001CC6B398|nr:signal peptidase I [Geobacter sp. AOG2]
MTESTETPPVEQNSVRGKSKFREYGESIFWAIILALIIRTFVVQAYKIPSGSMEDTLAIGDHLLVNKFIYGTRIPFTHLRVLKIRNPKRGDVIVFQFPEDRSKDFIKRVIGVPGDVIQERDKQVYVNGVPYRNPHEVHKDPEVFPKEVNPRDNFGPVTVPANSYFMMGDNRDRSYDSRFWGFIKESDIRGEAIIKYWSWDQNSWRVRWGSIGQLIN